MNSVKHMYYFYLLFILSVQSCYSGVGSDFGKVATEKAAPAITALADSIKDVANSGPNFGTNFGLNTLRECKKYCIAVGAFAVVKAKATAALATGAAKATYVLAVAHPYVSVPIAAGTVIYGGYCFYRSDMAERAALALKESERIIAEEAAQQSRELTAKAFEQARELLEREQRLKEESARVIRECFEKKAQVELELMLRNAKIKNVLVISTAVTVAGAGLCYIGYKYYQSRKQKRQEQQLFAAKQTLLSTLVRNEHNEIGLFRLPSGCADAASALLVLPGGRVALDEIVGTIQNPRIAITQL